MGYIKNCRNIHIHIDLKGSFNKSQIFNIVEINRKKLLIHIPINTVLYNRFVQQNGFVLILAQK